jgi:hypothetical protein
VTEIVRDRWERPLIQPVGGGEPYGYTRPSTLAKSLEDLSNLMLWKQRKTAQGLLMRPDLMTRVAGVIAKGKGDSETDYKTKQALNAICAEATEAAGASVGSSAGTGFHEFTEALDEGLDPQYITEADRQRVEAYRYATRNLEPLEAEVFVVNDIVHSAGTFDRLWRLPDGRVVVGDLKSGKSEAAYPLATTIQIAVYANGKKYDPKTGERFDIHPDLDPKVGLLVHMPPSGGCELYELDLILGWKAAWVAMQAREIRAIKPNVLSRPVFFDEDATMTHNQGDEQ